MKAKPRLRLITVHVPQMGYCCYCDEFVGNGTTAKAAYIEWDLARINKRFYQKLMNRKWWEFWK